MLSSDKSLNNSVLIACFDFPPNMGIGGRRWAKLAKGLAEKGYRVFVIKASPIQGNKTSVWTTDVAHPNIQIHEIKRIYPRVLSHGPKNTFEKIMYRAHRVRLRLSQKGTIYDVATMWEHRFITNATDLIVRERIPTLIATGAPFNLLYFSAKIKALMPFIRFIADYRDPWLSARNYGMTDLSHAQKKHEFEKQKFVFRHADLVTSPYTELNQRMQAEADTDYTPPMTVLPHFYDPSDFSSIRKTASRTGRNKIDLLYGGTLYNGTETYLQTMADGLSLLEKNAPELYHRLSIEFYTNDQKHAVLFADHQDVVVFHLPIGKDFFKRAAEASGLIVLLAEHNRHFATTKFFEYLPWRKPLLYIGPSGDVSDFILAQRLGCAPNTPEDIAMQLALYAQDKQVFNNDYQADQHSLTEVTKQLITCIEKTRIRRP